MFLCPAFFEAGRITVNDTHYIEEQGRRIPTSDTEFAGDSVFCYSSSHLPSYVEEKTGGRIPADRVRSLSVQLLRNPDPAALIDFLRELQHQEYAVVNAERYEDLYRLADALLAAVAEGKRFCFQSAAAAVPSGKSESRQIPFVIFPGNVGDDRTLLHVITFLDSPVPSSR